MQRIRGLLQPLHLSRKQPLQPLAALHQQPAALLQRQLQLAGQAARRLPGRWHSAPSSAVRTCCTAADLHRGCGGAEQLHEPAVLLGVQRACHHGGWRLAQHILQPLSQQLRRRFLRQRRRQPSARLQLQRVCHTGRLCCGRPLSQQHHRTAAHEQLACKSRAMREAYFSATGRAQFSKQAHAAGLHWSQQFQCHFKV